MGANRGQHWSDTEIAALLDVWGDDMLQFADQIREGWLTHAKISFKGPLTRKTFIASRRGVALNGVLIEGRRSWPHPQLPVDARALQ